MLSSHDDAYLDKSDKSRRNLLFAFEPIPVSVTGRFPLCIRRVLGQFTPKDKTVHHISPSLSARHPPLHHRVDISSIPAKKCQHVFFPRGYEYASISSSDSDHVGHPRIFNINGPHGLHLARFHTPSCTPWIV